MAHLLAGDDPGDRPRALARGTFDGLHRGHRALLSALREQARRRDAAACVVLRTDTAPRLLAPDERIEALLSAGVETIYAASEGTAPAHGFAVEVRGACRSPRTPAAVSPPPPATIEVARVTWNGAAITVARIAERLERANFEAAAAMLGRRFTLRGRVIHGRQLGRKLGAPTANLALQLDPPLRGIYAAQVQLTDESEPPWPAMAYLGKRPTLDAAADARLQLEVHLLDFSGDLYGRRLTVEPLARVADEVTLPDLPALRRRIAENVARVRAHFATG